MKIDMTLFMNSNTTGFGIHANGLLKALMKADKNIAVILLQDIRYQIINKYVKQGLENAKHITGKEPSLLIYHASDCMRFHGSKRYAFGIFETDLIPPHELVLYKTLDEIFVPSKWAKTILMAHMIDEEKIRIVPEGVDDDIFRITQTSDEIIHRMRQRGYLTFIHIGKYEERKSTRTIIKAFQAAVEFTGIPAVLNMKVANPFDNQWHEDYAIAVAGDMNIRKYNRDNVTDEVMAMGYHDADFGLYASKGEAWGLPILEGIACGLPTITTNRTGMSEYIKLYPKDLIIKDGTKHIADDGKFFRGDRGDWIVPNYEEIVERIKFTLVNAEQIYRIDRHKCIDAVKDFTWENAVRGII